MLTLVSADRLGAVFFPVKSDVGGNVEKLKKALAAAPADTLQELLKNEKAAKKHTAKEAASLALLWLKRYQPHVLHEFPSEYFVDFCMYFQSTAIHFCSLGEDNRGKGREQGCEGGV